MRAASTYNALASSERTRDFEEMPHYWPEDRVPVLGVSYCHLIQGILGTILISFIGYMVFVLP